MTKYMQTRYRHTYYIQLKESTVQAPHANHLPLRCSLQASRQVNDRNCHTTPYGNCVYTLQRSCAMIRSELSLLQKDRSQYINNSKAIHDDLNANIKRNRASCNPVID
jgi:hypothetical protein